MKTKLTRILAGVMTAAMCVGLGACAKTPAASGSGTASSTMSAGSTGTDKLAKIKASGKLIVGTSADYPPFEFHQIVSGQDKIEGADIEVAQAIAKDLGVKLQVEDMSFDGLLPALTTGTVDMVIAGMTVSDERKQSVDFSDIYYTVNLKLLMRKADVNKYKSLDSFNGKSVAAQTGTSNEDAVKTEQPKANLVSLAKIPDMILELKSNKVEAVNLDSVVAASYAKKNKDLAVSDLSYATPPDQTAIAVAKGDNTSYLAAVNKTLDSLVSGKKIEAWVTKYDDVANS